MELTFLGASQVVTGSCYLFNVNGNKVLLDCGMFQGLPEIVERNSKKFSFEPYEIDYVILSHAHIDHSGLLPKLVKDGFKGKIVSTKITKELCKIMLEDSAYVQEKNTETLNKHRERIGEPPLQPIYTTLDAKRTMERFKLLEYGKLMKLNDVFSIRFSNAGHILGSAIIELFVHESGRVKKFVFSGDLGQRNALLVQDPELINSADYVLIESTYGNKLHPSMAERKKQLAKLILENNKKEGKLFVPSFAVERTQEILYTISELVQEKVLKEPEVYLDSPLAIKATKLFEKYQYVMDKAAQKKKDHLFRFRGLHFSLKKNDSVKINSIVRPITVIAGSGMCTGGRILHHFKNGIYDSKNSVLFVGYQAEGTLGRAILEGAKEVEIFGEEVKVKAKVSAIESFSAHADYKDLIWWLSGFTSKPKQVFIIHGEHATQSAFKERIDSLGFISYIPRLGEKVIL